MTQYPPKKVNLLIISVDQSFKKSDMSGPDKNNPFSQWGALFGDPKDPTLSASTRNECLALLTQNEIMDRGLSTSQDDSPRKKIFLERASIINGLTHATV